MGQVSVVTNVIFTCSHDEETGSDSDERDSRPADLCNAALMGTHVGSVGFVTPPLATESSWLGGGKRLEGVVLIGAFNYLDLDQWLTNLRAQPWLYPELIRVFVMGDNDEYFTERFQR